MLDRIPSPWRSRDLGQREAEVDEELGQQRAAMLSPMRYRKMKPSTHSALLQPSRVMNSRTAATTDSRMFFGGVP